jgi:hypothetical protein
MKKRTHLTSILALTLAVALGGLAELGMLDGAFAQGPQAGSRDAEPSTAKSSAPADEPSRASDYDLKLAETLKTRAGDWRVGPIVYQVMVDRFAPSSTPSGPFTARPKNCVNGPICRKEAEN